MTEDKKMEECMKEDKDLSAGAVEAAEESETAAETEAAETSSEESGEATGPDAEGSDVEAGIETGGEADADAKDESSDDKYVRLLAEFQNYKRRTAKEKTDIRTYANEKIAGDLLPVMDNFERALATNAGDDPEAYAKGMAMIFDQLKTALNNVGVKEVEALGEDFDPTRHNAVMHSESEEYEEGKVCMVLQKGYELNGKIIRAAMVAVAK
ncbi:MAG: nucleotide exchange factor GrpE [Firmicutes bacterium]|nr:nucleotide exchange factor GrpE [Bacillota bacterium]